MEKHIKIPFIEDEINNLKSGDYVYLTGEIYTARDAAHKRLYDMIMNNESLPIDLKDKVIYYMGPSPEKPGNVIGSAGPTTSTRMDKYTPTLLDLGLKAMIGKGKRNNIVIESMIKNKAIYFIAVGGAGALLSQRIIKSEIIAFDDLGTEAIRRLYVKDFPVFVAIDYWGNDIYRF